ncbi:MAG: hypothetical protein ACRD3F_00955 [Acidobacteriaceae bacterium]
MRRILAIPLLLLFMLPIALPFFSASAAEASVPVCCRRNGKHHCMMMLSSGHSNTTLIGDRCPYSPTEPAMLIPASFAPSISASVFAGLTRHPSAAPQVEAQQRISFDRSRQKRGPPEKIA